jgi:hypothetical protein
MTHIVIHDDSSSVTHYAEFDDVQAAASYLEDLVNRDGGANARLFALEPVEFAVKSYVRVEIGTAAPAAEIADAIDDPVDEAPLAPADVAADDTVEYVEAAMAPFDAFATSASELTDGLPGGETRRGLFGR